MGLIVGGTPRAGQIDYPMQSEEPFELEVPPGYAGQRLDQALARLLPDYSRSVLKTWIDAGRITLGGMSVKPRHLLLGGEHITLRPDVSRRTDAGPDPIHLDVVYQDSDLIVINKPAGLVVHPGAGNATGTLLNALLHHDPSCAELPRAGIVHRLDKDTTGLMVVSRSLRANTGLLRQLRDRSIRREYQAIVRGVPVAGGTLTAPIGRHPTARTRMAVVRGGRAAVTHFQIVSRFRHHALLQVRLETGRTHQIRVHLADARYPIVGDPVYGGRTLLPRGVSPALASALSAFKRQALHAWRLTLSHPLTGAECCWEAPLPADMEQLVADLRDDAKAGAGDPK